MALYIYKSKKQFVCKADENLLVRWFIETYNSSLYIESEEELKGFLGIDENSTKETIERFNSIRDWFIENDLFGWDLDLEE